MSEGVGDSLLPPPPNPSRCFCSGHVEPIAAIGQVKQYVVTGSYDRTIRKWDMVSCRCLNVYTGKLRRRVRSSCQRS